jgi:hypothetical protein
MIQLPVAASALRSRRARGFAIGRLLFWVALGVWAWASWNIAAPIAYNVRERINDLSVVVGGGLIMRDPEGVFYHVNSLGKARPIYPELGPPTYEEACYDCTLVTGEQLSQTNDFCISGVPRDLPSLQFEIPCRTWAPQGTGRRVIAFGLFIIPLLVYWLLKTLINRRTQETLD